MHSKKDIKLKGILTGRWGQFMDSRKTGVHLGLGWLCWYYRHYQPGQQVMLPQQTTAAMRQVMSLSPCQPVVMTRMSVYLRRKARRESFWIWQIPTARLMQARFLLVLARCRNSQHWRPVAEHGSWWIFPSWSPMTTSPAMARLYCQLRER